MLIAIARLRETSDAVSVTKALGAVLPVIHMPSQVLEAEGAKREKGLEKRRGWRREGAGEERGWRREGAGEEKGGGEEKGLEKERNRRRKGCQFWLLSKHRLWLLACWYVSGVMKTVDAVVSSEVRPSRKTRRSFRTKSRMNSRE